MNSAIDAWCVLQSFEIEHRSLNLIWYQCHGRYLEFLSLATSSLGTSVAIIRYFLHFLNLQKLRVTLLTSTYFTMAISPDASLSSSNSVHCC